MLKPFTLLCLAVVFPLSLPAQVPVAPLEFETHAVVCQSPQAAAIGADTLARGGNAVDAAVAAAFALAVTYPEAGNIGGGGFMVVFLPREASAPILTTFDFRETAPARAHPRMFLDAKGAYDPQRHHHSHIAVGIPGSVAGLALAHARYGTRPWRELILPAIGLARDGVVVSRGLAASLGRVAKQFQPPGAPIPFLRNGRAIEAGSRLVQPELAATLERIAEEGPGEFYRGETARHLLAEMERGGGLIEAGDLESYRAIERPAVLGTYRGHTIASMGPPGSGGVALIEMLNILEGFDLASAGFASASAIHLQAEAMRRAFADRARYIGDPDHATVPIARLVDKDYAEQIRRTLSTERASESSPTSFEWPRVGTDTTHLSVVDARGGAVALTTTLEQPFGSRIWVPGAGFLLNNEMGDFNAAPGLTTVDGRIGTAANLAAPGKRMLSSMTPTIVLSEGQVAAVLGSPGGRTIINSVLAVLINWIDHRMSIQEAVDAPRVHHQWLPDLLWLEPGHSPDTVRALEQLGHRVRWRHGGQGSVMAITIQREASVAGTKRTVQVGRDRRRADSGARGD